LPASLVFLVPRGCDVSRLEELTPNTSLRGIVPDALVTVESVRWFGDTALELIYKTATGKVDTQILYRDDEPRLEVVEIGRPWSFDGDGGLFRLVSEANRIQLAHLFDPLLAVHTSVVEPLPHQITAVYESMLPRQPLRFLLADDPGAGKTIMAGLLMRELIARGDLQRCLVVCPGSLAEQWQDELFRRFNLPFEILTNDKLESARTGNWFLETDLVIARLDKLSRNEDVQQKLLAPDCRWDLVVCDEAHKMSATVFGNEIKYTKRYKLGQLLSTVTRHFLLMTATPHNGKEEDFQLFLALLDGDRFEGRFRDGVHTVDVSADRPHGSLQAVRRRSPALRRGHRVRARGVQPGRQSAEGQTQHGRLRPDRTAAAARLFARGDLPVAPAPTGAASGAPGGGPHPRPGRPSGTRRGALRLPAP